MLDKYRSEVIRILKQKHEDLDVSLIEIPPEPSMGDFAFPCFSLAKTWHKAPAQIASELASSLEPSGAIRSIQGAGPYVNFYVDEKMLAEDYLHKRGQRRKTGSKIMVEFSSPNTNKPLHLGHLRNISLGESVSRLRGFSGDEVVRSCLVNDRGIHICKSMLMYQKHGEDREPDKKSDHFVGEFYVMYNEEEKKNKSIEDEAKEMLKQWEQGHENVMKLWKRMNRWANDGFNETYERLGIRFDKFYFESDIYKEGREIIENGHRRGVFDEEDGAIVADLDEFKLPKKVLIRSDGTSLYMTQDVYLAKLKFDEFSLDTSVYVVGNEQDNHFRQLFAILKKLDFGFADRCYHLSYGMVNLPSGKMKSREGTVVDADDIIDRMQELAREEVESRYPDIIEKEKKERSEKIGLGALKFYLLRIDPARDMTFDPEESISFEGETGPYVQYTYARSSSILRKHGSEIDMNIDLNIYSDNELILLKKLAAFDDIASAAAESMRPSSLCRYLLDLCQMFNEYYHSTPVLKADDGETVKARLVLVSKVRETIRQGLDLLGIDVLEEM